MKKHIVETIVFKNRNGSIVKYEDHLFGGTEYKLFDPHGFFVKNLSVPFKVSDYL